MSLAPGARRAAWCAIWFVLAAFLVVRAGKRPPDRGVILDHLEFGRRLLHGEDVHAPRTKPKDGVVLPLHPPYPPSFGLLTAPFALLDGAFGQRVARIAWALLQVGMLAWTGILLRRLAAPRAPPAGTAATAAAERIGWHSLWFFTFLLGLRFVMRDAHGGGGNLINVGLCTGAFAAALGGRAAPAGLLLGFSLLTKPTQIWLLPVFFLLGHRRTVAYTVATGVGGVLLTMALQHFDLTAWWRWLAGSWSIAVQADPYAVPAHDFPPFTWMNQALRFAVARWCGEVPPEFAARVPWGVWQGLGLPAATVAWITRGLSALLLGGVLVAAWRGRRAGPEAQLRVFAAALTLSVLLSPLSWKAHHVALLPALFLLVRCAASMPARALRVLLVAFALTVALPGGDVVGDACDEWLNSTYVVTAWDVVLLVLLLRRP